MKLVAFESKCNDFSRTLKKRNFDNHKLLKAYFLEKIPKARSIKKKYVELYSKIEDGQPDIEFSDVWEKEVRSILEATPQPAKPLKGVFGGFKNKPLVG